MDRPLPLRARALRKNYSGRVVVDDVDLALEPGSVLGLVGRNGAGKSTLLRGMLGLIPLDGGEAWLFGESSRELPDSVKERVAYVPQTPSALAWLTPAQMLELHSRFYPRWDHELVRSTLPTWGLDSSQTLATLSPGQRQRAEILRALAQRSDLLVLDEPASALDPAARRDLLREIAARAGDAGTTVIFSSHILSDLERIASDVVVLHRGRVLLRAPLDDLRERFARVTIPADDAAISRRSARTTTAGTTLVVERDGAGHWPVGLGSARLDALGLEDLFLELTS